jgi:SHS2 domain-containing protein
MLTHANIRQKIEMTNDIKFKIANRWIDETLENKAVGLPTRKEYETRVKVKKKFFIVSTSNSAKQYLSNL